MASLNAKAFGDFLGKQKVTKETMSAQQNATGSFHAMKCGAFSEAVEKQS
jgi:hypothetical protein